MKEHNILQTKPGFSVVIPALNEAENLEVLHTRLTRVMVSLGEPYEIIFIDDGSTDSSFQMLRDLHQKDSNVKACRFTGTSGNIICKAAGTQ